MRLRDHLHEAFLALQTKAWAVPAPVRRFARAVMNRVVSSEESPALEPWDTPLVPGMSPISLADAVALPPNAREPHDAGPAVSQRSRGHCLVLTDVLDVGGVDEFAALLARRLASVGWSVSVIKTGAPGGYLAEQLIAEGVQVMEAQSPAELEAALRGLNPDVVSAHAPASWCLGTVRLLKLPIVETLHGAPTPLTTDWRSEPERSTSITAFVAVSQFVRQHYLSGNPQYPADAVITVPIGYDPAARPRADRNISRGWLGLTTEFLFTSLGRCSAEKNTYGLIDAFADMARSAPDSHLLVAGRVDDPNYARHVVKLIGAQPRDVRVRIHLRENTSVVPAVLSASDCFVMDSFYEGWGMASVEALAAGLPIIRSDTGGAVEQVGPNGQRGYLVGNPVGCSGSVTWDSIARWRFSEQPNKAELSSAMLAAVEARDSWSHQRESIASKSMSLFPIADFVRQHAEILERAAAHPDSVAFAQAAGANSPVIRQDGSRP